MITGTKSLEDIGYRISDSTARRRKALSSAIRKLGSQKVMDRLRSRKNRASGYQRKRYERDLRWVKRRGDDFGFDFF